MVNIKLSKLKRYDKIVIYGAGCFAKKVIADLRSNNIIVDYCIVTNKELNPVSIESILVYQVKDCYMDIKKENTIIIIAVSDLYKNEIITILNLYNIQNYIELSDLYRTTNISLEFYRNKSDEEYITNIAEWYWDQNIEEFSDFIQAKKWIIELIKQNKKRKKIVFAVGDVSPRVVKIAKALSDQGYEIKIFICPGGLIREVCIDALRKTKISCHICENVEELIYHIIIEKASIVHIFSQRGNSAIAYALIKMKRLLPKIVYDEYDIINEMYVSEPKEFYEAERFCLENADGICNRGYELEYLVNEAHYTLSDKMIQFMDYCKDNTNIIYHKKDEREPLSLCYAGSIFTQKECPDLSVCCWEELAGLCERNQCHLHLYPLVWDEEKYTEYIMMERENKYFHFHHPIPFEKLEEELSQYDYEVIPARKDFLTKEADGFYHRRKYIYGCANKYFDALDAGLPLVSAFLVKFTQFFESKGVCLRWTMEEYDFKQLKEKRNEMKKRVVHVQEEFQIKNHIHKLIDFYNSI